MTPEQLKVRRIIAEIIDIFDAEWVTEAEWDTTDGRKAANVKWVREAKVGQLRMFDDDGGK